MASCGHVYSDFLDSNGNVWHCGTFEWVPDPLGKVGGLPKVQFIQTGQVYSMYLDGEGSVWIYGYGFPLSRVDGLPHLMVAGNRFKTTKSARR